MVNLRSFCLIHICYFCSSQVKSQNKIRSYFRTFKIEEVCLFFGFGIIFWVCKSPNHLVSLTTHQNKVHYMLIHLLFEEINTIQRVKRKYNCHMLWKYLSYNMQICIFVLVSSPVFPSDILILFKFIIVHLHSLVVFGMSCCLSWLLYALNNSLPNYKTRPEVYTWLLWA